MIDRLLKRQLEPVARDHRRWRRSRGLAACWLAAAAVGIALLLLRHFNGWWSPLVAPVLIGATLLATLWIWRRSREDGFDYAAIARQLETEDPRLHALLLTAVEQQPDATTGELNYLQQRVVTEALAWKRRHLWEQYSGQRLFFAQCRQWAALLLLVAVLINLPAKGPAGVLFSGTRSNGVNVTPGDTSVERGSSLVVLARFEGRMPVEASLVVQPAAGEQRRIPLTKNLDDPVFGGSVPDVKDALSYRIEFAGGRTREFQVTVFEFPELEHADAHIKFPEYTGLPEKTIPNIRRISAVEGSSLDYTFHLNKPVASATLIGRDKAALPLTPDPSRSNVFHAAFALDQSRQYELQLIDDAGRTNKLPPLFVIEVLKNRPPDLKLVAPGDQRVSPLEEIRFKAEAEDDFGLRAYGIAYSLAGGETRYVELGQSASLREKRLLDYLLPLEDLAVATDQLVSYFVWADDAGPDGAARRTSSDMYFAEIRPFDEIFREGPQQEGGGQQGGEQGGESEKLAELQKQIVTATWNLQRRETGAKPSGKFQPDAKVIQDSQKEALSQAQALQEQTDDPRLRGLVDATVKEMEKAVDHLDDAAGNNSLEALPPALSAEQAAYQALLRLQAREFQVSRSRSQQGGGGGGQRSQRQIDQLDLKASENRYETQREAAPQQQAQQQREQLQVLSRLKELAQRQQDLNERIKELQTALQEAESEEEREEARRRLKRLREEQQELMAGIDELNQRMSRPENQSRMAEAQKQLEQTRSEVQNAAESLEDGAVSQALASGARAQRNLQQMSEDLRKQSSSQFSEDMRRMREEARELARKQEELQRQLQTPAPSQQQKTLRDSASDDRQKLASGFNDQARRIDQLLEHANQVTQQAENVEPLLSRQLYDTLRKTSQDDAKNLQETTDELLRSGQLVRPVYERLQSGRSESKRSVAVASDLLRDGFSGEASQLAEKAGRSINELKQDVEKAAASVLGDDTEALRLAARELEDLARQLEREMAGTDSTNRTTGAGASTESAANQAAADAQGAQAGQGQPSGEGTRPGGPQDSPPTASGNSQSAGQQPAPGSAGQPGSAQASTGQPGGSQQTGNSPGQGQPGGTESAGAQAGGQSEGRGPRNQTASGDGGGRFFDRRAGEGADGGGGGGGGGPITGADYTQWADRLRDVEDMLEFPDLRTDVARIRDRARAFRQEYRRAGEKPSWAQVRLEISGPLVEVRSRIAEELARRQSTEAPVPADRDPVPAKFAELVRRYYEQLGKSE